MDPMKTLDADHVINLKRVLANHKEAWLMLMPVPSGANRGFGAAIEKNLPEITGDASSHPMEPLLLLKSFAVSAIKTEADLVELTRQIIGQLEKDAKVDEIVELAVAAYRELRRKLS